MSTGKYAGQRCTKEIYDWERANAPDDITVGFLMTEEDVDMALRHPLVVLGSDGLRHHEQGHPRAAGAFPRFIAEYIRTGKVGLMEGIAKMTCRSAERLGLLSRHIQKELAGMARQLRRGSIAADPYYRSAQENACLSCDYFSACHFAEGEGGEKSRYLAKLTTEEVWKRMEEGDENG
jgi:hypothetical protein